MKKLKFEKMENQENQKWEPMTESQVRAAAHLQVIVDAITYKEAIDDAYTKIRYITPKDYSITPEMASILSLNPYTKLAHIIGYCIELSKQEAKTEQTRSNP